MMRDVRGWKTERREAREKWAAGCGGGRLSTASASALRCDRPGQRARSRLAGGMRVRALVWVLVWVLVLQAAAGLLLLCLRRGAM